MNWIAMVALALASGATPMQLQLLPRGSTFAAPGAAATDEAHPDLDFDLLGTPEVGAAVAATLPDPAAVERRRTMLQVHQGLGMGLMLLEASTLVMGQLDYRDRYGGGSRSGDFRKPHAALAYSTFALFLANEAIALLAPVPIEKPSQGLDRATVHKIGLFAAAAGMVAQTGLGIYSAHYASVDQRPALAKAHLFLGYGTYLAMAIGVGAFVF